MPPEMFFSGGFTAIKTADRKCGLLQIPEDNYLLEN